MTSSGGAMTSWLITVYYTAVEHLHDSPPKSVKGHQDIGCEGRKVRLGSYAGSFVRAVIDEGAGLTRSGAYLNWSHDTGFWLDTAARDSHGGALRPFVTAAADPAVLPRGTRFRIVDCGREDDGSAIDDTVAHVMRAAWWEIADEFTPGLGGAHHLDVYLGEQTSTDFTESPWYVTMNDAIITPSPGAEHPAGSTAAPDSQGVGSSSTRGISRWVRSW